MLRSFVRVFLLVAAFAVSMFLVWYICRSVMLPDPDSRITALPPQGPGYKYHIAQDEPAVSPNHSDILESEGFLPDTGTAAPNAAGRAGRPDWPELLKDPADREMIEKIKSRMIEKRGYAGYSLPARPGWDTLVIARLTEFADSIRWADYRASWGPDSADRKRTGVIKSMDGYAEIRRSYPESKIDTAVNISPLFYFKKGNDPEWWPIWNIYRGYPDSPPGHGAFVRASQIVEYDYSAFPLLGVISDGDTASGLFAFRAMIFDEKPIPESAPWRAVFKGRELSRCRVKADRSILGSATLENFDPNLFSGAERIADRYRHPLSHRRYLVLGHDNAKPVAWTREDVIDFSALFDDLHRRAGFPYSSGQFREQIRLQLQEDPKEFSYDAVGRFSVSGGFMHDHLMRKMQFPFAEVIQYNLKDSRTLYLINICVDQYKGRPEIFTLNYLYYAERDSICCLRNSVAWGNVFYARFTLVDVVDTIEPGNRFFVLYLDGYCDFGYYIHDLKNGVELRDLWQDHT